ncbi:hypothetical protein [Synechococcus sp. CB0205]|uniref:hypothetical protein n=1 Tax=Synechococcus sp. CB0205 TaxID=232363 RepID=UPI0012E9A484|nr:hypothetical protein [Synechococcus sp. CB0205]
MRKVIAAGLASILSTTTATALAGSSSLPYFCKYPPKRGLTSEQRLQCENPEDAKAKREKEEILSEPTYPFESADLGTLDSKTGKTIYIRLTSQDGSTIKAIEYGSKREVLSINTKEVVEWKVIQGASGTDSSAAIGAVAGGALFFWPMLLAAPFMVRNYSIMNYQVSYIDEYGNKKD